MDRENDDFIFDNSEDDNDDYIVDSAEAGEEMGIDYHLPIEGVPTTKPATTKVSKRKYCLRRMPVSWAKKFKDVSTILFTKSDGKQIIFVR